MKQFLALSLGVLFLSTASQAALLDCPHIYPLMRGFLNQHVTTRSYSSTLEKRIIDQYIKRLDGSKLYLLADDVAKIEKSLATLNEKFRDKQCDVLFEIQAVYSKRMEERAKFAERYLGGDFKIDKSMEADMDPKHRAYPASQELANKLHEQYIQFQVANLMASGMKIREAKDQVVRRYKRNMKNLAEISREDIFSGFLDSFAGGLDPHSSFFSHDDLEDFQIQMQLSLEGIGATLSSQDGYTTIEHIIPGGAASRSGGLEVQDRIVGVGQGATGNMESVIDEPLRDVVKKIRGKKGTVVRLSILRKGEKKESFNVTLVRDKINLEEEAAKLSYIEKSTGGKKRVLGVLDLPSFYASSKGRSAAKDIKKLLKEARDKKIDGIVLDLSNNGGGSLEDAVKIAGLFFRTGTVVSTQSGSDRFDALADDDPSVDWAGPLVVLTSRLSASASEIVAGALKDYKRGVIIGGDHTFGKGSVQSVIPLPDELGALKVTVGMFFIPGGNSTQHRGVDADIILPGVYSTDEIGEKSLDYSLPPKTFKPFASAEAYVKQGTDAWTTVEKATVDTLRTASEKRVSASADFKKVFEEIERMKKDKSKTIKISEVLDDKKSEVKKKKEKEKKNLSADAKKREYLKRPEVMEALAVLSDLIEEQEKPSVNVVSAPKAAGTPALETKAQ